MPTGSTAGQGTNSCQSWSRTDHSCRATAELHLCPISKRKDPLISYFHSRYARIYEGPSRRLYPLHQDPSIGRLQQCEPGSGGNLGSTLRQLCSRFLLNDAVRSVSPPVRQDQRISDLSVDFAVEMQSLNIWHSELKSSSTAFALRR